MPETVDLDEYEFELDTDEFVKEVNVTVEVQIVTSKGEISEQFHNLEDAEEYLDRVEALKEKYRDICPDCGQVIKLDDESKADYQGKLWHKRCWE